MMNKIDMLFNVIQKKASGEGEKGRCLNVITPLA